MFADVSDTGLVMLSGWLTLLVGVSVLRESSPLRRARRGAGAAMLLAGLGLAVWARVAV